MPFNYQTLINITSAAIIDGSITNAELATSAITDAKIADTTITSGKFATGAVDLSTSTVTGTTPFSKGGTGTASLGTAYHVLQTNAANNALEFSDSGIRRMVVFTGSGTYTKTAGARYALVQVQGPGGGASGHGESGAAGGYAERLVDISGISTVSVTINGGGGGTYYSGAAGNAGGSCSFVAATNRDHQAWAVLVFLEGQHLQAIHKGATLRTITKDMLQTEPVVLVDIFQGTEDQMVDLE